MDVNNEVRDAGGGAERGGGERQRRWSREESDPYEQPYSLADNVESLVVHTEKASAAAEDTAENIDSADGEAETIVGSDGHDLDQNFSLEQDGIVLNLSAVMSESSASDEPALQPEDATLILVGGQHSTVPAEVMA